MGVNWTKEQQQVIDLRNRNILVSAAAGSGKTAVLVERIIAMITDRAHPIDIDRLLIVTFTKAAAGEMRERIQTAIEKKLSQDVENEHLQRQTTLVHHAQITTIDSFCSYVVRSYFHLIDLDPGYRMGEDGEMKLLRSDVASQILEDAYEKREEDFLAFIESYSTGKTDEGIEEMILKLYDFSMSYPWPKEWLSECKEAYAVDSVEKLCESNWMQTLLQDVKRATAEGAELTEQALCIARGEDGPYMYEEALLEDQKILSSLLGAEDFQRLWEILENITFARLSSKKDTAVSDESRETVKALRDQVKKLLKELREQYFFCDLQETMEHMKRAGVPVKVLIDLTIQFLDTFSQKKREKNILDFSDLEHFALEILVCHSQEGDTLTAAAQELAEGFEEIMIDEYQDSNYVQELLMNSVSGLYQGKHNIFMVGDVKQSIYRFRLARPELFMTKFHTYSTEEGQCQRIDLHKNFRSREEVLSGVNFLFEQIMCRNLGGVEYDKEAALYPGAVFPTMDESKRTENSERIEVLLVETDEKEWEELETDENSQELEARAVAMKIKEIVGKEWVLGKERGAANGSNAYHKVRYRDCVILLRTISGWAETFGRVLNAHGIPANVTSRTGYFSASEVVTVLNYLHICDNPRQEIPFTGVLHSPIGGFTAEELAVVKSRHKELPMYECARAFLNESRQREESLTLEEKELIRKWNVFFTVYEKLRGKVSYTPIHQLIWDILEETGYLTYVEALPGGQQRRGNLEMLMEKAIDFESTSYRGLFNFIRYIEQLQKYQVDFGEANTASENEDAVRIMSIHKSKGLEFPIVFVSGMGKRFNQQDARSKLVMHPDLGIGADCVDFKLRTKTPALIKKVIQKQTVLENLGEELRVLYVALTRAKEKLIVTGTTTKLEKRLGSYQLLKSREIMALSYGSLAKALCCWDWVLPALARHRSMVSLYDRYDMVPYSLNPLYDYPAAFGIQVVSPTELVEEEVIVQGTREIMRERFRDWDAEIIYDKEIRKEIEERFAYQYPFMQEQDIPVKVSVSEVKRQSNLTADSYEMYEEPDIIPLIPAFMQESKDEKLQGAARGTAYHRVMECLDYLKAGTLDEIKSQISGFVKKGKMTQEMADCIIPEEILQFAESKLGRRMADADRRGELYREQQFVLGISAAQLQPQWSQDEGVLVQGIIDAFFYEEGAMVLADYKTDQIPGKDPMKLAEKYRIQLEYYAKALERMTGKEVKDKMIYSFALGREIRC